VESHLVLKIASAGSLAVPVGGFFPLLITCGAEKRYLCFWFVFRQTSTFNLWPCYAFVW